MLAAPDALRAIVRAISTRICRRRDIAYEPVALSGAAVLVRRAAFDAVGAFEEAFVNGSEDVDLCLKLWAAGYRCRYEPRATIVHLEGASRGKAIDGAPNDRLLQSRWNHRVAAVPRYHEPLPPLLDLRWHSATPLESAVKRCFRAALAAHAGARVVENNPGLARVAAALDRRARLSIEHRGRGPVCDVVWCAPETPADAGALHARDAQRYWVPSQRGAELLRAAGVAHGSIAITRPGFAVPASEPPRPIAGAIVVQRLGTPPAEDVAAQHGARCDPGRAHRRRTRRRRGGAADPHGRASWCSPTRAMRGVCSALRRSPGGALVVAFAASPFLETMPA